MGQTRQGSLCCTVVSFSPSTDTTTHVYYRHPPPPTTTTAATTPPPGNDRRRRSLIMEFLTAIADHSYFSLDVRLKEGEDSLRSFHLLLPLVSKASYLHSTRISSLFGIPSKSTTLPGPSRARRSCTKAMFISGFGFAEVDEPLAKGVRGGDVMVNVEAVIGERGRESTREMILCV
ncbi:hypothetical protein Tco_1493237 [Tanacetum coccineum]